jgi:hypothetical protein
LTKGQDDSITYGHLDLCIKFLTLMKSLCNEYIFFYYQKTNVLQRSTHEHFQSKRFMKNNKLTMEIIFDLSVIDQNQTRKESFNFYNLK